MDTDSSGNVTVHNNITSNPTAADYLTLSDAVYGLANAGAPTPPQGWSLMTFADGTPAYVSLSNGMQAAAFQNNDTHQIVIAYEGTNLGNINSSSSSSSAAAVNLAFFNGQMADEQAIQTGQSFGANTSALDFAAQVEAV